MIDQESIEEHLCELAAIDDRIKKLWGLVGTPEFNIRESGCAALIKIIIEQQVSTKAANAIWNRLVAEGFISNPLKFTSESGQTLRELGLSRQKVSYCRNIVSLSSSGDFKFDDLNKMSDQDAITTLVSLKGIGLWSAEIYLIFVLGRQDIIPADDLALLIAAGRYFDNGERWPSKLLRSESEKWKPWRSVATWYFWRSLDPIPVEY